MLFIALVVASSLVAGTDPQSLALELRLTSPARSPVGADIALDMALVNRGSAPQQVVKPGDGSESGWREPHVWLTGERLVGKDWQPMTTQPIGRCGLYDPDWQKDVIALAPGARMPIDAWMPGPGTTLDLAKPGRYRLTLHYAFGGHRKGGDGTDSRPPDGPMRDVAPFTIDSPPVELEIVRRR